MAAVHRIFPMLSVNDMARSLRFYHELLGGEKVYQFPDNGPSAFVVLRFGESDLGIGALGDDEPLHGQPQRPASGHRVEFCVYVDDVEREVGRLSKEGVPVLLEPVDTPWGERVAYVSDPDGNLLMLTQAED